MVDPVQALEGVRLLGVPWNKFAFLDVSSQQDKEDDTSEGEIEEVPQEAAAEGDAAEGPLISSAQGPFVRYGYLNMRQRLLHRGPGL